MIITKDFPDKVFATKQELFAALRENASKIIAVKKAEIQKSHEKGYSFHAFLNKDTDPSKSVAGMKDGYVYPVINTTKYMDSHRDVHFDGIWNKSAKEQNGKLFYVTDHEVKIDSVIAWPEDVNVVVKSVPWSFVGKNYEGYTEALIYEIPKDKIVHEKAKDIINNKRPVQNSVRMMYVKMQLGMDSVEKEDIEFKKYFDSRFDQIANKEQVQELGYFWGVEEAKIVTEGSMVIKGSNDATPVRQTEYEPVNSTQSEPMKVTPVFDVLEAIKQTQFVNF